MDRASRRRCARRLARHRRRHREQQLLRDDAQRRRRAALRADAVRAPRRRPAAVLPVADAAPGGRRPAVSGADAGPQRRAALGAGRQAGGARHAPAGALGRTTDHGALRGDRRGSRTTPRRGPRVRRPSAEPARPRLVARRRGARARTSRHVATCAAGRRSGAAAVDVVGRDGPARPRTCSGTTRCSSTTRRPTRRRRRSSAA